MTLLDVIKVNKEAKTPEEFLGITRDRAYEILYEVNLIKNKVESYKDLVLKCMSLYDKIEENLLALMYACFIFGKHVEQGESMERWIQKQKDVFLNLREQ